MSNYDSGLWVVSDDEIWVTSDKYIWIPVILRGVVTFVAVNKIYLLESKYEYRIFISNPNKNEHEFISNNNDRLFVSNPSEDEDEFVSNNNVRLFISIPSEDEDEFDSNNIITTFVSKKRSVIINSRTNT